MNLSVNLIEDTEKRQGGSTSLLFFIRTVSLAIPVLLVLVVIHLAVSLTLDKTQLERTEAMIQDKKDQLAVSAEIMKQQRVYREMLAQLNGWMSLRIDWNKQLEALRLTVPVEVQITSMKINQTLTITNNTPTTLHTLFMTGKTGGINPESNLTRFRQNLSKNPKLSELLTDVIVPEGAFTEDTSPGANPTDRLFELKCTFKPRGYK